MITTIYLIRHSIKMKHPVDFPHSEFDRFQPLSAEGEELAKKLLELDYLRGADAAVSSPFARSIATIRYLIEADNVSYSLDERLRELKFGANPDIPRDGRPPKPSSPDSFKARQWIDKDLAAEGGESINQCCARMSAAIRDISLKYEGKKVLVGSHGAAIGSYLSGVMDGVDDSYVMSIKCPDVFKLEYENGKCINVERKQF